MINAIIDKMKQTETYSEEWFLLLYILMKVFEQEEKYGYIFATKIRELMGQLKDDTND